MTVSTVYIAAATNRFNQAADASPSSDLIAFGSSRLLALWNLNTPNDEGIVCTLTGSQALITCVKFLRDDVLISSTEAGLLSLWKKQSSQWKSTASVQAHSKSISSICVLGDCIVTGSSDFSIKIWRLVEEDPKHEFIQRQTLDLKGKLPIVSALTKLPQSDVLLLAVGGTDNKVQLWACSENQFVHAATLSGHEDWIRSLAFKYPSTEDAPLVLASGSQDTTIRLWNIERRQKLLTNPAEDLVDELLDNFESSLGDLGENEEGGKQISLKHHIITVKTKSGSPQQYSITFDALLVGHEAGITSLAWRPDGSGLPTLLSTSTDSSLILWSPSAIDSTSIISSIWINRQRFGDVGGQRLGGFTGGLWARSGTQALAWGWSGGWRRWCCTPLDETSDETWNEIGAITGHNGPVKGLDWSSDSSYLISSSLDQTTRIHGPLQSPDGGPASWHEIARPQVHGYDLLNVVFITPLRFASLADEKVIRVFEAPRGFVDLTEKLGVAQFNEKEKVRPAAANVPPLGLSNKAIGDGSQELIGGFDSSRRPFDGELALLTLWPEVEKIFGHGYESITLGVSNSRKLIATGCKATNAEHAVVRVYDTECYHLVGEPLRGHDLSVTRISFRPDDKYILTVSRDRSWRLFEMQESGGYTPVATDKAHGRIIWDCAWSTEGDVFATASRDKTVKIWSQEEGKWTVVVTIKTQQPATAVAFAPMNERKKRHLAIGLETGVILIYSSLLTSLKDWHLEETITSDLAHIDQIHRMAWRPSTINPHELATCSEDGTLRIFRVQLTPE